MNSFTYTTYDDYLAARADEGEVGSLLTQEYILESGEVSNAVISYIIETGQIFTDAVNIILPMSEGAPGDMLVCHNPTGAFMWVKGGVKGLGTAYILSGVLTEKGYTPIGLLAHRNGNKCIIISESDEYISFFDHSTLTSWGAAASDNITTLLKCERADGMLCDNAALSHSLTKSVYDTYDIEFNPIRRVIWEEAKRSYYTLHTIDGTLITGGTLYAYELTENDVILFSARVTLEEGAVSAQMTYQKRIGNDYAEEIFDPVDYGWDYQRWYDANIKGRFSDDGGRLDTSVLAQVLQPESYYAANVAYRKCILSPADPQSGQRQEITPFGISAWWLPSVAEWAKIMRNADRLHLKNTDDWAYWTSTQNDLEYAWVVDMNSCTMKRKYKNAYAAVRAITEFEITQ